MFVVDVTSGAGLAVPHQDLGMQIAHGPLSIVIGVAAGILLGFVCALTPVWSSPLSRAAALLVMGELMAFCGWVKQLTSDQWQYSQLARPFESKSYLCGFCVF